MPVEEVIFDRFLRGANPYQAGADNLYARLMEKDQVAYAGGVRVEPEGVLRKRLDRFRISRPSGAAGKTLLGIHEYRTGTNNQLLAAFSDGVLYKLETDWENASPTQWNYTYELFASESWSAIGSSLPTSGRYAFAQCGEDLIIAHPGMATKRWDGSTLEDVGIATPTGKPLLVGGVEDLSAWTEEDAGGYLNVSPNTKVTATNLPGNATAYLYKDFSADHFGDFVHTLEFQVTAADLGGYLILAGYTNDGATVPASWSSGLWVAAYYDGSNVRVGIGINGAHYACNVVNYALSLNTTYYVDIGRYGTNFIVYVYSDADKTQLVAQANYTVSSDAYRYAYLCAAEGGTDTETISGYVENFDIHEQAFDTGVLPSGTYSYYYTWFNDNYESMPSQVLHVRLTSSDKKISLQGIAPGPTGVTGRKIYRAYTSSTEPGAVGPAFLHVATIYDNTTTTFVDNTPETALGDAIAFDHAMPPRGEILVWHHNRAWMSGCSCSSRSYTEYDTEGLENVLFYSELDEPYYWPANNYIRVGDASAILDLVPWGDHLVIIKESSVWILTGYSEDDFVLQQLTDSVGGLATGMAAAGPDGVLWASPTGLWFYDGASVRQVLVNHLGAVDLAPLSYVSSITYHDGRFYIVSAGGLSWVWRPSTWTWETLDALCGAPYGFVKAFNYGAKQCHVLSFGYFMPDPELFVYDTGRAFLHYADGGSLGTFGGEVHVILPPLVAAPGEEIMPLEVWVDGEWTNPGVEADHVKVFINDDGSTSTTPPANAWETTPDAPQGNGVVGVPLGYAYDSSYKTNAFSTAWITLRATGAVPDFVLRAVRVRFFRRPARGGN